MRIRAERDDLADVLARAGRAVGTRSPLPILQGVLCEVQAGRLRVTGTDTEVTVRTTLEVEVLEEGRTLVPAKLAAEAVRKLPAGAVTVTAADGEVEITGNGPRFKLRELTVDDFPVISTVTATGAPEVDGDVFIKAVSQVGVAASSDEARPTLTGVLFEKENDALRLVATDSYRLAVRDLPGVDGTETTLVPFRALRELGRTIGDKKMAVDVGDFPDPHVGVDHRDVGERAELQAVELACDPEHGLAHLLELEVGLHLFLVDVVLRLPHLLAALGLQAARAGGLLPHDGGRQRGGPRLVLAQLVLHDRPR